MPIEFMAKVLKCTQLSQVRYKGDITILDTHVLQEIGKNSVILHEKI